MKKVLIALLALPLPLLSQAYWGKGEKKVTNQSQVSISVTKVSVQVIPFGEVETQNKHLALTLSYSVKNNGPQTIEREVVSFKPGDASQDQLPLKKTSVCSDELKSLAKPQPSQFIKTSPGSETAQTKVFKDSILLGTPAMFWGCVAYQNLGETPIQVEAVKLFVRTGLDSKGKVVVLENRIITLPR